MANCRITVNGQTQMDGDLGQWTTEPPFISEQRLAIATKRDEPWAIPVMNLVAMAGAGAVGRTNWTMSVNYDGNGTEIVIQTKATDDRT